MASDTTFSAVVPTVSLSENTGGTPPASTAQERQQTVRLPAALDMRDLVALIVLIVLTASDITGVQYMGPAAFLYWTLGLLAFLLPCAFVTQWLARRFGRQGACDLWASHIVGIGASLFGMWGTVTNSLTSTISDSHWAALVVVTTLTVLAVGVICSQVLGVHARLSEQRRVTERSVTLRAQPQESCTQQHVLLEEVDRLYREQAQAAVTDPITCLLHHRAVMGRIEEEVELESPLERKEGHSAEVMTIQALTAAALAHDRTTGTHSMRMVRLAVAVAYRLNLPKEEIHLIRLGALLHDIGKIGIPDAILHKPGPLTDAEWAIMRTHPYIGRQILLETGGVFEQLAHIVIAHHERWDGQGYPARLVQDAIPLGARIISVVDAYDAMTSDRAYREAMPVAEARIELQRCAGSQFDPLIVETFLGMLDEQEEHLLLAEGLRAD